MRLSGFGGSVLVTVMVSSGTVLAFRAALEPPFHIDDGLDAHEALTAPPAVTEPAADGEAEEADEEDEYEPERPPIDRSLERHGHRACAAGAGALEEAVAREMFVEAVDAFRRKDGDEACCILDRLAADAPGGSVWGDKAAGLHERRCAAPPPSASRAELAARMRLLIDRGCHTDVMGLLRAYRQADLRAPEQAQVFAERIQRDERACAEAKETLRGLPADPVDLPGCVHSGHATTEDGARALFEEAIGALRNRDAPEGCCLLARIVEQSPEESLWGAKAEGLANRRCRN